MDNWISVSDRLPKEIEGGDRGYVMVYLRKDRQWGYPTRLGFGKWDRVNCNSHTHWQPLPPPPKQIVHTPEETNAWDNTMDN